MVTPNLEGLTHERRNDYLRYAKLYREFIRPLLPTCKMYHHSPISARGGVTANGWFAIEYASPDRAKGWATIARIGESESDTYIFTPRGLHRGKTYTVTFDSTGESATIDGLRLVQAGIPINLESIAAPICCALKNSNDILRGFPLYPLRRLWERDPSPNSYCSFCRLG